MLRATELGSPTYSPPPPTHVYHRTLPARYPNSMYPKWESYCAFPPPRSRKPPTTCSVFLDFIGNHIPDKFPSVPRYLQFHYVPRIYTSQWSALQTLSELERLQRFLIRNPISRVSVNGPDAITRYLYHAKLKRIELGLLEWPQGYWNYDIEKTSWDYEYVESIMKKFLAELITYEKMCVVAEAEEDERVKRRRHIEMSERRKAELKLLEHLGEYESPPGSPCGSNDAVVRGDTPPVAVLGRSSMGKDDESSQDSYIPFAFSPPPETISNEPSVDPELAGNTLLMSPALTGKESSISSHGSASNGSEVSTDYSEWAEALTNHQTIQGLGYWSNLSTVDIFDVPGTPDSYQERYVAAGSGAGDTLVHPFSGVTSQQPQGPITIPIDTAIQPPEEPDVFDGFEFMGLGEVFDEVSQQEPSDAGSESQRPIVAAPVEDVKSEEPRDSDVAQDLREPNLEGASRSSIDNDSFKKF